MSPNLGFNTSNTKQKYKAGEILVKFKDGVSNAGINSVFSQNSLQFKKEIPLVNGHLVKIPQNSSVEEMIAALQRNPLVEIAQPNYLYYPQAPVAPNDPSFGSLWGLDQVNDIDIDALEAWQFPEGNNEVVVAVIDSGANINHPDLQNKIWVNPGEIPGNGLDDDGNLLVDDVNGWDFVNNDNTVFDYLNGDTHGTHVAGTIAAVANNSIGVTGVARKVKIMPLKFIGPAGGDTNDAIAAINYAKSKGVKISNNSWGGGGHDPLLEAAIEASGQVFVAAAGNDNRNIDVATAAYPASYANSNIISVAAIDSIGSRATFSNYGSVSVDVGAPGVNILSTTPALPTLAAAVYSNTYSAFHFGFGLEQITDPSNRGDILNKALTQLGVANTDPILVVDDDNSDYSIKPDYRPEFQTALAGYANVAYGVYDNTVDGPDLATMQNFSAVIWFSGASFGDTNNKVLRPNDLNNLRSYLSNSGRLILTGNDIAYGVENDSLFTSYLNISFVGEEAARKSVVGAQGTSFNGINYALNGNLLYFKDALQVSGNSTVALNYPAITDYGNLDGTSMAAPHVSGIAALLLSIDPNLTPQQLKSLIETTGKPLSSLNGTTVTGKLVSAYNALAKLTIPGAPQGLAARGGNGKANLTWSSSTEPDVVGYNVYRKDGSTLTKLNTVTVAGTTYAVPNLTNGTSYEFGITAVDIYNIESPMATRVVTAGMTAPVIASVYGQNTSGVLSSNRNPQVVVNGVTVGEYVYLYNGATPLNTPALVSTGSSITITLSNLADGEYNITAKYKDVFGEESPASNTFTYTVDATAPAKPTINPLASSNSWTFNIIGAAEANSTVKANINGASATNTVTAAAGNTFTFPVTVAADGSYSIKVTATDAAGNVSPESDPITVAVDAPPGIATRNPAANATGVALGSNIEFTFNQEVIAETVYSAAYPNNVQLLKGTQVLPVAITYDQGNKKVIIDPIANLDEGTTYTVSVSGVKDTNGNPMPLTTWQFVAYQTPTTSPGGGGGLVAATNTGEVTVKPGESTTISSGDLQITIPIGATNEKLAAKVTPLETKDTAYTAIDKIADTFAGKIITAFDFTLTPEKGNVDIKRGLTITFKTGNTDKDYAFYRLDPVLNTLVPIKTLDRKDGIEATITQPGKLVVLEEKMPSFTDLKTTNWSTPYIFGLAQKNIINGMSDGKFDPTANLTRGQLSKIITLSAGIPGTNNSAGFNDVTGQTWSTPFINTAKSAGVINGYADGSFKPDKAVTRAELLKMVVTATGLKVEYQQGDFNDTKGHWAEKFIATATKAGIVGGYSDGSFKPDAPVTREEAAKIIAIASGYVKPAI
ncbi:MAG: S8 family serine peptidase [Clostridia bacterium]|nr:S8 family serine peptidase [Clostridia bacterium]